jgi:purine-binding chemotaxis protein CheW
VTFALDREEYGIPVTQVREVIGWPTSPGPQAPAHFAGPNLRGRILRSELRSRLGLSRRRPPRSRIVVVEVADRVLGLLVDAVLQVVKVPVETVAPPPEEVLSADSGYLGGVARWNGRLIILLS